ncbi:MAG: DUF2203 domain-containing protein [Planctomycetes bacterium]|nr:DUF2203 domain-containing protein [Planctomycetota bacterium]
MAARKSGPTKKYFTPAQANAMLPLVRRIVQDITELASALRERQERIARAARPTRREADETGREELDRVEETLQAEEEFERGRERMTGYVKELRKLGVELKDFFVGLIDFPCWMDGREVYLCWRQGEPEVGHWHEVDAGFAGRQKLLQEAH